MRFILTVVLIAILWPVSYSQSTTLTGVLRSYNLTLGYNPNLVSEVPALRAQGFEILWLIRTVPEQLGPLLDACQANGMTVILDVGESPGWWQYSPTAELAVIADHVNRVSALWGNHPAFYGWYAGHEIAYAESVSVEAMTLIYGGMVTACRSHDARPVMVSPFFILDQTGTLAGFNMYISPETYGARWKALLTATHLDIVAVQDSGEHMGYYSNCDRIPFLLEMAKACRETGTRFWVNVETLEMNFTSLQDYVAQNGNVALWGAANRPWIQVPTARLNSKMYYANLAGAERLVTWGR